MRDIRSIAAGSWKVTVALTLVVTATPLPVRAGIPEAPAVVHDEPVSPAIAAAPLEVPPELAMPPAAEPRPEEAARIFEAQRLTTADARFLHAAGAARSRAGHHAVALRWFELCLTVLNREGRLTEPVRVFLEGARQREVAATLPVHIVLVEPTAGGRQQVPGSALHAARTVLRQLGPTGEAVPGSSFEFTGPFPPELRLDPGPWYVQIDAPGFTATAGQQVASPATALWTFSVVRPKVVVDLRFAPERALRGARMRLRAIDHTSPLALERPLMGPTATVMLTPGPWQLEVRARRHRADMNLSIGPGQRPIDVALVRATAVEDSRLASDRKLLFGLFGAFCATYFTSIGLLIAGARSEKRIERRDAAAYADAGLDPAEPEMIDPAEQAALESNYAAARLHRDFARAIDLQTAGAVLGGASLGAALSLVSLGPRGRRSAAVVGLGFGAALAAGGAGWMAWSRGETDSLLEDPARRVTPARLDRGDGHRIASSLLAGLGLGLVVFSGVALAHDAAVRRKRARAFTTAPWAAPGLAGWSLAGRF